MAMINFTTEIFKEGSMYVAYSHEFDVSSCGHSIEEARKNLKDAVVGFLESAKSRGVLKEILGEAGYETETNIDQLKGPELLMLERSTVSVQYA